MFTRPTYRSLLKLHQNHQLIQTCCPLTLTRPFWVSINPRATSSRAYSIQAQAIQPACEPLRKQLKEEAKRRRAASKLGSSDPASIKSRNDEWELTVGIEIHAQLNTERKLFSC